MSLGREQIHIAPQGYERERIYQPPIENGADKVILLEHIGDSENGEEEISRAQECISEVQRELLKEDIEVQIQECDIFNINSTALAVAELVNSYPGEDVYVNISTGSKLSAIGSMIACTATDAEPYYVHAEGYIGETVTKGGYRIEKLATYPLTVPHKQYLEVLNFVDGEDEVNKGDIVRFSQDMPLLSGYDRSQERNWYKPVTEEIIDPLVEQGYLLPQPRGSETLYTLSDEAKETLEILRYLVE